MIRSGPARESMSARARSLLLACAAATLCLAAACTASSVSPTPTPAVAASKLAYVQDGNVWTMTLPGGSPHRITTSGQTIGPSWSPSGRWLAYGDGAGTRVVRADGNSARDVFGFYAWSPVEDRFAVVDKGGAIYVENADGSAHRVVVPPPRPIGDTKVQLGPLMWSPDGTRLAYQQLFQGTSGTPPYRAASLWVVRVDGGAPTQIYDAGSPSQNDPGLIGWSPARDALFFMLDPSFSASIPNDGLALQAVRVDPATTPRLVPFVPSPATMLPRGEFWSAQPRRSSIAVTDGAGRETWTNKRIALVSSPAGTVTELTPADVAAIEPAWSPDGQRVAHVAAPDAGTGVSGGDAAKAAMAKRKIWVMDADGSNARQLTNDPAYRDERPQWLADGSIVFVRLDAADSASLWLVPASGGTPARVVDRLSPPETSTVTPPLWFGYYGYVAWDTMFSLWTPSPAAAGAAASTTPVVFPVAPADRDASVWDFVRRWQGANISPILRPGFVPPGFNTVTVGQLPNKLDPDLLAVEYSGPGRTLVILAGGLNPGPGDSQRQVQVRGQPGVLAMTRVQDAAGSVEWMSLWWQEPRMGTGTIGHPLCEVRATGLTEQELIQVAESLTPIGP